MPTVASYTEAAKAALLAGEVEQAASVCRHILTCYPKHVEANCLLGEALRDQEAIGQARDIFLRVVSADPTNLVAHWALSLIAEAANDKEWAAWELLRAWESNPGHPELRHELQRLTGSKPSLTPFALAQTYAAGGLFDDAVEELHRLLSAEPTRLDVAAALAETLWRAGRSEEAARVCEKILSDSPDCLKANILLGCWLCNGPSEGREKGGRLLHRALELDPGAGVAAELLAGQSLPAVLSSPPAEIPPMAEEAEVGLAQESPDQSREARESQQLAEALAPAGGVASSSDSAARRETNELALPTAEEPRLTEAATTGQRGRSRSRPDLVDWLRDTGEQPATVREALEARLASQAAQRSAADWQALADLDPEWQDLLTEEITLDKDSEERLSRALAEMSLAHGEKPGKGWVEVPTASTGPRARLPDLTRGQVPAGTATRADDDTLPTAPSGPRSAAGVPPDSPPTATPPRPVDRVAKMVAGFGDRRESGPERAAALWEGGDAEAALEEYRELLRSEPRLADQIVEGVKGLIRAYPDLAAAHRVLGDAYMRSGRFQQAIDEYNWVLTNRRPDA